MKKLFLLVISVMLLSGCNINAASEDSTTEEDVRLVEIIASGDAIEVCADNNKAVFTYERFPITKDGVIFGWGKLNFVERLGIWDLYNSYAVQNGVQHSYAVNLDIDMGEYLSNNSNISLMCTPSIIWGETVIGDSCDVGWSGFDTTAELFDLNKSAIIEVTVQPRNTTFEEETFLRLDFKTADSSIIFDSVLLNKSVLVDAIDGVSIKTINDKITIDSINGAQYSIQISDVFREVHKVDNERYLKDGEYLFYDFVYQLTYEKAPTVDRVVTTFDSFDNESLSCKLNVLVRADTDETVLLENVYGAMRTIYSDSRKVETYCFDVNTRLKEGDTISIQNNRLVPDSTTADAKYLRIQIEFPEERNARTSEEMQIFNGRYLVFQVPFSERSMEVKP